MRTFLDGTGADSTAAVLAYLASRHQIELVNFYVIRTAPCYAGQYLDKTFLLTDYPAPLHWSYKGTFQSANISRGEVESKIGLEVDTVEVHWAPSASDVLATGGSTVLLDVLDGFEAGIFDNGTCELWQCIMPLPGELIGSPAVAAKLGNCDYFGACLLFAGRIGDIVPDGLKVVIPIISRVETLNEQIPTNLIEPTNILAQYLTGQLPSGGPSSMAIASGSTVDKIYADDVASPAVTMPAGTYDSGYLRFSGSGKLSGHFARVRAQTVEGGHHAFYLSESLPFAAAIGDTVIAYIPIPRDFATALPSGNGYAGFPFVPNQTNSSVVIA